MSFSNDRPAEKLISEPITPVRESFNTTAMAAGLPGVPMAFVWRGKKYRVQNVLENKRTLRPCRNGSGEQYAGKHYFTVKTESGETMTLYRSRSGSKKDEWILYTMKESEKKQMHSSPIRIAVLVSGGGTNLQALIDAEDAGRQVYTETNVISVSDYKIVLVVADRKCFALERARKHNIPASLVSPSADVSRTERRRHISDQVLALAREYQADALVLAGFLTIMSGPVITEYAGRIVNLHPALLPKFGGPGMWGHHVHEAVLAAGETESGCTIHLVDSGCDSGPILLQKKVPVLPGDTADALAARISGEEHLAIVEGVRLLARRLSENG